MTIHTEKRTYSGALLEVDLYPAFPNGRRLPSRAPKSKPSSEEQKKYNRACAVKKFIRLANANFGTTDYLMHPTYTPKQAPKTEEEARRDVVNYLRRVKSKRQREAKRIRKDLRQAEAAAKSMPEKPFLKEAAADLKKRLKKLEEPFRYIYVIEKQTYKTGPFAGSANWHFHMFVSGGLEACLMESIWKNGIRANCNRYQPEKFGPEAAARYMSKDPKGSKRFCYSKNLKKPIVKKKSSPLTKSSVGRIASERADDRAYWEKKYKGYRFLRCFPRWNDFNGNWYITTILYKTTDPVPEWEGEKWVTSDYMTT